jgi:hypothetical protein
MRTVDPYTPSLGSSHDPILHGVATGLADLFPPVDHPVGFADGAQDTAEAIAELASISEDTSDGGM